jgi:RNA polymerase sigma factor (sigma-70 family)
LTNLSTSRLRKLGSEARTLDRLRRRRDEFVELEPADAELWAAVRALPRGQRAVVVLYYVEDRSIEDVAQILEIAPGTTKSSLHDARHALARALGTSDAKERSV